MNFPPDYTLDRDTGRNFIYTENMLGGVLNYQLRQCVHLLDISFVKDLMLYPWSILT